MTNILKTIVRIVNKPIIKVKDHYSSLNRANQVGDALEEYVKDAFANSFELSKAGSEIKYEENFSYLGNTNNPPDIMIKGGDAIEIKKMNKPGGILQLNSSHPKSKLHSDNPKLNKACRECENWDIKDFIYVVGHLVKNNIKTLWFVYGDCFVADREVYNRIFNDVKTGISAIPGIDFGNTVEPGRINKVDPLGYTDLRLRGMWHIRHPKNIFDYLNLYSSEANFQLISIMRKEKFDSFDEGDKNLINMIVDENFSISDEKIKNPNNPAELIDCKIIQFRI